MAVFSLSSWCLLGQYLENLSQVKFIKNFNFDVFFAYRLRNFVLCIVQWK